MRSVTLLGVLLVCGCGAGPRNSASPKEPADISDLFQLLLEELNSDDPHVRERATEALSVLAVSLNSRIRDALAEATDPEVRARLQIALSAVGKVQGTVSFDGTGYHVHLERRLDEPSPESAWILEGGVVYTTYVTTRVVRSQAGGSEPHKERR